MIKEATIFKEWFDQIRTEAERVGKIEGKIEIARKMLAKGLQPSLIAELTGVSEEEILHFSQDLELQAVQ